MLERNASLKLAPQRFQDSKESLDVIICFEDKVFEAVMEELQMRDNEFEKPVHILNLNTKDKNVNKFIIHKGRSNKNGKVINKILCSIRKYGRLGK
jgi:RNA polymerase II subunit A C-terminal domain phosphatase SSU72